MGQLASIRIIKRPPPAKIQFKAIQDEIKKQLQPVGKQHVAERKKIVADFDTKIEFGYQIATTEKQVTLTVNVTNANTSLPDSDWTVGDLWKALDKEGTRSHPIDAKNAEFLRFQTDYQPHTQPIARSGGPGAATGEVLYRRHVDHLGFKPRKFSEKINARLRRQFEQATDRGVRLGGKRR